MNPRHRLLPVFAAVAVAVAATLFLVSSARAGDFFDKAPRYGGFCACGVAGGCGAATDPAAFSVVAGKFGVAYTTHAG